VSDTVKALRAGWLIPYVDERVGGR